MTEENVLEVEAVETPIQENRPLLLETIDVKKKFGRVDAVNGITVQIPRGQIVGLIGPNGSGKSTFLKLVAGLLKPDQGTVLVEGRKPGLKTKAMVAFEPEGDCLYDWMTVGRLVKFVKSLTPDWEDKKAGELMEFLHLTDHMNDKINGLSKGWKARVKLLLTMSRNAPLVLLDEPLSGIDPVSRARIIQSLVGQFHAEAQTIIIFTHEVAETEGMFDRVIFLEGGCVKIDGDAQDLRTKHGRSIQGIVEEVFE
jgi:ABC-2 type transport system ATP-binding protein